jgi:hypothetical protein
VKSAQRSHASTSRLTILIGTAILSTSMLAGCGPQESAEGSFDKTMTVQGPIRLELATGSGEAHVVVGGDGEVKVHGDIHVSDWSKGESQQRVQQLQSNPPIVQEGSVIRVGDTGKHWGSGAVDYTITVPASTDFSGKTGSGDLSVTGLQGPVTILSGSGDINLAQIGGDVRATSGSGDFTFSNIAGQIQIISGSGDVTLSYPKNEVRIQTGSGDIQITQPADAVTIQTGNGDVEINSAAPDLRIHTASGGITITGDPHAGAFWDLHAASGDVALNVSPSASFELHAHTSSGDIDAQIPIMMEGTTGSHELRARIGDAKAHVEASTASGDITLR